MAAPRVAAAQKPLEAIAALVAALAESPPRLILLTNASSARADEPYLAEYCIAKIVKNAAARGAEVLRYDAGVAGFDPAGLYSELSTRSMFAAATVRIVKNADVHIRGRAGAAGDGAEGDPEESAVGGPGGTGETLAPSSRSREAAAHPLERAALSFVKSGGAEEHLVLVGRKFRSPFLRAVREAGGVVYEFRPLYDKPFRGSGPVDSTELGEFIQMLARDMGLRLAAGTMPALVQKTGNQPGAIAAALEKLQSILQKGEITPARVQEHVAQSRPGSPWLLAEAILCGDPAKAFEEIAALEAAGARDGDGRMIAAEGAYVMALAALRRDGMRNLEAAERLKKGGAVEQVILQFGIPNIPSLVESFARQLRARSAAGHRRLLDWVAETELAMRVHGEKARSAVERLACRARATARPAGARRSGD
jgi:hypothetical protein